MKDVNSELSLNSKAIFEQGISTKPPQFDFAIQKTFHTLLLGNQNVDVQKCWSGIIPVGHVRWRNNCAWKSHICSLIIPLRMIKYRFQSLVCPSRIVGRISMNREVKMSLDKKQSTRLENTVHCLSRNPRFSQMLPDAESHDNVKFVT